MAASSSDRNPSKLVAAQLAALRPKTGMYNNKRIYASVVQADSPFQEEPRQGSPARILDECGQASELHGLPRKLIQFQRSEHGPAESRVERRRRLRSFRRAEQRVGIVVDRSVPGQAMKHGVLRLLRRPRRRKPFGRRRGPGLPPRGVGARRLGIGRHDAGHPPQPRRRMRAFQGPRSSRVLEHVRMRPQSERERREPFVSGGGSGGQHQRRPRVLVLLVAAD